MPVHGANQGGHSSSFRHAGRRAVAASDCRTQGALGAAAARSLPIALLARSPRPSAAHLTEGYLTCPLSSILSMRSTTEIRLPLLEAQAATRKGHFRVRAFAVVFDSPYKLARLSCGQ